MSRRIARSLDRLPRQGTLRRPGVSVIVLALLAGLAYRRLLLWDPSQPGLPNAEWFFFSIGDTAPQIVFAIAAFLLYRRRGRLAAALGGEGSTLRALPLLGAGLALFLWAHYVDATDLLLVSLILFCLGSALLLFGARFARELALPLLLLLFALPLPGALTNQIVFPLQLWNAELSAQLLNAAGIPVVQEGDMLYFANRSLEIIETCGGLRSILILTMMAVGLVCYFPAGRMHLLLLVASALGIACLVNIARILVMALSPHSEGAETHALQGAVLFLVGSAAVCVVDVVLRRRTDGGTPDATAGEPAAAMPTSRHADGIGQLTALVVLLGLMSGASIWMPRWTAPLATGSARIALPREIGDWKMVEGLKPDWRYLGSVRFRKHLYRRYQRGDETVSVFIGFDDRLDRSRSLFSRKHALPGAGWQIEEREPIELDGLRAESVSARSGSSRILSYYGYEGADPLVLEILRAWLATDQSPLRRRGGAWVIRLSTEVAPTRKEQEAAEARLRGFAEVLLPSLSFREEAT